MPVVKIAQGDADSRYRQVVEQIKQAIHAGSLLPETRLPSVRTLAAQYGISLTTALKALRTLEDEHYAVAKPKSGFFVVLRKEYMQEGSVVVGQPRELAPLEEQTELHMAMVGENCRVRLDLANGDISLYPIKKLGLIMCLLGYSKPSLLGDMVKGTGCTPLKAEIVRRAVDYGCNINPDNILITNGCVEALSLSLRATVTAGDVVAVESPSYFVLLQMLRDLNLRVIEVDACKEGYVDSKKLVALFRESAVKVFVTLEILIIH